MFQVSGIPDPIRLLVEIIGIGATVWGLLHQDRKERKKEAEQRDREKQDKADEMEQIQRKRHEENKDALDELKTQLEYHPPHAHTESDGPLTTKGIMYGPPWRRAKPR